MVCHLDTVGAGCVERKNGEAMENSLFNYRYQIIEKLGEGAQGQVCLARDVVTDRMVALKVLHVDQADSWRSLFKHEFEILADLSHPFLAQVHDFGVTSAGQMYFTRDYVEGVDFRVATQSIDAKQFVSLCIQICRSIRPLHQCGLLHGDIKPGNLVFGSMVKTETGVSRSTVWPIDFSFVRPAHGAAVARGTLYYMPPEMLEGKPVDVRADLYSLGVTFFEAASGRFPFEGNVASILQSHQSKQQPVLSFSRIAQNDEQDANIIRKLSPIIVRLLCYEKKDRFPDMGELEAALIGLCPTVEPVDEESYLPSRNVLANKDGFSNKILEQIYLRQQKEIDIPLFIIQGEVGSGRSAIRKAIKWQAQLGGFTVVEISFSMAGDLFAPMGNLLRQVAIVLGGTPAEQECETLIEQMENFSQLETEVFKIAQRISMLLVKATAISPILFTVENMERAPCEALGIVREILAHAQTDPRLIVLATGVSKFSWADFWSNATSFAIPLLGKEEITKLVRQYLGIEDISLGAQILSRTGGNPLFVTQLLADCVKTSGNPHDVIAKTVVTDIQAYWRQQLLQLNSINREVLEACAVLRRPATAGEISTVAKQTKLNEEGLLLLSQAGWLNNSNARYWLRSTSLVDEVLRNIPPQRHTLYAERAFDMETMPERKVFHGAQCGKGAFLRNQAISTIESLEKQGALSVAKPLLKAVLKSGALENQQEKAKLILARVEIAQGELDSATPVLGELVASSQLEIKQSALRYLGKIAVQQMKLDEAAVLLESALRIDETGEAASSCFYDLCEIEFRRGRYEQAIEFANQGIDLLDEISEKRANLLCSKAKGYAAQGNHKVAMVLADEAVEISTRLNLKQVLAFARDVRAWVLSLQGEVKQATEELEKCAILYREVGDNARLARSLQVIGNNYWWLERWSLMLKKHREAMRVAASLDNPVTRNEQLISYGYALNCLGRFENAALALNRAKKEAIRLQNDFQIAKVAVYQGDWCAWQGRLEDALKSWQLGYDGFKKFSNYALLAELTLEMAGVHIQKQTDVDLEIGHQLIVKANEYQREDLGRHFEYLLALRRGQYQLAKGNFEQGCESLEELAVSLKNEGIRELQWQANLYLAEAMLEKSLRVLARKKLREAESLLLALATGLPASHQISFWQDVRRARVKSLLQKVESQNISESAQVNVPHVADEEASKLYKVLEINKRISKETDADKLMEEILDAAIELTGAERGFFLAKAKDGLEVRAAREMSHHETTSSHQQFSSSIAESVYLDKEPVVTVDAASDTRFNEFLSIHHLQVKSVACLPIVYRTGVLGVLYLENRLAKGNFDGKDMRVLSAFSDQMAISLAHAKALKQTHTVQRELKETAGQLQTLVDKQSADLATKQAGLELAKEQLNRIKQRVEGTGNYHGLIGSGPLMQRVFNIIERIKNNNIPVTIVGPSGSGKDAVARVIHELGQWQSGPFVSLACGAVPENLVESTLFGHKQGAFSGAGADAVGIFGSAVGGTLYLDDIAEMPRRMQVDLLRVLQEGTFVPLGSNQQIQADFRLLCSSKVPLSELVEQGILRMDLFYRLQVVSVNLPPLRDRSEDIPLLAKRIAKLEAAKLEVPFVGFEPALMNRFVVQKWEGNVRELEQCIRRALVIGQCGEMLSEATVYQSELPIDSICSDSIALRSRQDRDDDEKKQIIAALEQTQWNKTKAAQILQMPRRTFYRRLKFFDIV